MVVQLSSNAATRLLPAAWRRRDFAGVVRVLAPAAATLVVFCAVLGALRCCRRARRSAISGSIGGGLVMKAIQALPSRSTARRSYEFGKNSYLRVALLPLHYFRVTSPMTRIAAGYIAAPAKTTSPALKTTASRSVPTW